MEATIANVANKVGVSGGGIAAWGGLTSTDLAAFGGLFLAVIGVLIQYYFARRTDRRRRDRERREQELHAAQMAAIARGDPE